MADETRERDRVAAVTARTTALRTIPIVAAAWVLVVVFVEVEFVVRVATLVALVVSVVLGARAAVSARRFLQRWLDPEALRPPPNWVTLLAVAGAVATFVGGANIAADISAGRPAVRAIVLTTVFLAGTLAAAYAHVAGGRGLSTALRSPAQDDPVSRPAGAGTDRAAKKAGVSPAAAHAVNASSAVLGASGHASGGADAGSGAVGGGGHASDGDATSAALAAGRNSSGGEDVDAALPPATEHGWRLQAAAEVQMAQLRVLLSDYLRATPDAAPIDTAAAVAEFRRRERMDVVAAAQRQLAAVRARRLGESGLAQVITLLGGTHYPPDHGATYSDWVAEIARGLALEPPVAKR